MSRDRLVGQRVAIGEWDYTEERLPHHIEGVIVERKAGDTVVVSLERPVVVAGNAERSLVLTARSGRFSDFVGGALRLFLARRLRQHPFFLQFLIPVVGACVVTESGGYVALATVHPRDVLDAMLGRPLDSDSGA